MQGRAHQLYRTDRKVETTHFNIFAGETSLLLSQFKIKHLHILGPPNAELIKAARRASQLAATERPPVPHFGQSS